MEDSKRLKISWMILAIGTVISIVVCIMSIINPLFTKGMFESYVGQSWSEFASEYPKHAALYQHHSRLVNCYWIAGSVFALFVILVSYRKGEKWAWAALLTVNILAQGTIIIFGAIFTDPVGIALGVISIAVVVIALLIPFKQIWAAKTPQSE